MLVNELDITYCEGWDPVSRTAVGLLPQELAAERDRRGEQYAVLVSAGRPWLLLEIAWGQGYWAVWRFDDQGRRITKYDHRVFYFEDPAHATKDLRSRTSSDFTAEVSYYHLKLKDPDDIPTVIERFRGMKGLWQARPVERCLLC